MSTHHQTQRRIEIQLLYQNHSWVKIAETNQFLCDEKKLNEVLVNEAIQIMYL